MTAAEVSPIISVRGLTAAYGDKVILEDIDCEVAPGEIFVILGGSGSGKSTLLKHLIGLYPPAAGSILIDGTELVHADDEVRRQILRKFGVMYQSGALFGSLTLRENICLPLEEFTDLDAPAMDFVARMKLQLVGLLEAAELLPAEISGGMQKRAAIARAMALDPAILFLDEPSAGLDPITSAELDELIIRLSRDLGITFVIVTHELPSIFAIADRVVMLDSTVKRIVATGPPAELRDSSDIPFVRQFFQRRTTMETP